MTHECLKCDLFGCNLMRSCKISYFEKQTLLERNYNLFIIFESFVGSAIKTGQMNDRDKNVSIFSKRKKTKSNLTNVYMHTLALIQKKKQIDNKKSIVILYNLKKLHCHFPIWSVSFFMYHQFSISQSKSANFFAKTIKIRFAFR